MTRIAFVAVSLSFALFACRGGDDGTTGDDTPPADGSGSNAGEVTIQEVQNDAMASGTQLELRGVVVTAIDSFGARTGDLWVGEPGGGAFSGVKVFHAPLDSIATLAVGDVVDITNIEKEEFACTVAICNSDWDPGVSTTEVQPISGGEMTITKISSGSPVAPTNVDALAISMLATPEARDAEWEKWEGVLINVQNARQLSAVSAFSDGNDDQKQFDVTGSLKVQSVLSDLGTNAVAGACFSGLTGIGDYFFSYLVLPRATTELVTGGTGCAALSTATITQVQAGTATGSVQINDVYVMAVAANKKNLWISTSLTAAANEGLYVRGTGANFPATVVAGAKVNILGSVLEFNNDATGETLTQLQMSSVAVTAAPTSAPVPLTGQTVTNLLANGTGEPLESVLVTLTNVKVTTVAAGTGSPSFGVSDLAQYPGPVAFKADDEIYLFVTGDADDCYASITGLWTYSVYDNKYELLPLGPGTAGTSCN